MPMLRRDREGATSIVSTTATDPAVAWASEDVEVAGSRLRLRRGGTGDPLLVLHRDTGSPERLPFYDALAGHFTVYLPRSPGLRWLRAPGVDAECPRRRGRVSVAAGRPRSPRGLAPGPRLRGLDRGGDGVDVTAGLPAPRSRRGHGDQAAAGRDLRPGDRELHRLRPRWLRGPGGVRAPLRGRTRDPPAGAVGPEPRDDVPHRVEAVHVQPEPAPSPGRRADPEPGGMGKRRPGRPAGLRRAVRARPRAGAARRGRGRRPLRRDGAARRPRRAHHQVHRRIRAPRSGAGHP